MRPHFSAMPVHQRVIVIYSAVWMWEGLTTPMVSHSDSWRGVYLSLFGLIVGAFWLGFKLRRVTWAFVFGMGGSLLFVGRFLNMDRFALWLAYRAPSTTTIIVVWILFALGLGLSCLTTAALAFALSERKFQ